MPLPGKNTQWPPAHLQPLLTTTAEAALWWDGDPEALHGFYSGSNQSTRPSSRGAGRSWLTSLKAMFWAKPKPASGRPSPRLHVPIATDLCQAHGGLLFSRPPQFLTPDGNDRAAERADLILADPRHHAAMLVAAESAAALRGVYGRVVWDPAVAENAWLDYIDVDKAVPEWRWGRLQAVTFWSELASDHPEDVWRHLERHEAGRIVHGVYKGSRDNLGKPMALQDHPATETLAASLTAGVDGEQWIDTGTNRLAAAYIPNRLPAVAWRNNPHLAPLGRGEITPAVIGMMDNLDRTWSSLMRDVEQGKGRLHVPEYMLQHNGPGRGAVFDSDHEVYTTLNVPPNEQNSAAAQIQQTQFAIRVTEHIDTAKALVREILHATGLSPITYGAEDVAAATATEVRAKSSRSEETRATKARLWSGQLAELGATLIEVDAHQFGTGATNTGPLQLDWPPMVEDTQLDLANTVLALSQSMSASIETRVRVLNPDRDETWIADEVAKILQETGMPVPDPLAATDQPL